ncbi:glutathione S-transferase [Kiloniella laminariae]|uniref:Glutathione S-transferase n=1 Tax=Kiloniella laminariae TaxID=454162 RepID=A0ABT4LHL4_9PROT|nr:glutathione S-transferase family protein [Kiloniella laminariae]MCZ4279856.1 glutathione S-transferase [Kiloniella laminariae]
MKLLYQTHSPYARKVLVMAHETGLVSRMTVVHMETSPTARNDEVFTLNPLGKVPVLVDEDEVIFDSSVICDYLGQKYLDQKHDGVKCLADDSKEYWATRELEALATGIADAGILARWELARRPEDKRYQPFLEGQLLKVKEACAYVGQKIVLDPADFGLGQMALATALSWLDYVGLRDFRADNPGLSAWLDTVSMRPSMQATAYSGTTLDLARPG